VTITKDQAQMLAHLAIACRPHRAPTWDEAGVMANIAKVKERALPEIVMAVIQAAADRECVSPGVIPSPGSHWQVAMKPPPFVPNVLGPGDRCGICGQSRDRCTTAPRFGDPKRDENDDHVFTPDYRPPTETDVAATVDALKAEIAHAPVVVEKKLADLLPTDPNPHATEARRVLASAQPAETEETAS
jgi:hypothetical protein